jgi:electron transfer flavoprotein beta subunit
MRITVVVEHGWDPASVEVDPLSGAVDERRTVSSIGDGSRAAVALALGLRDRGGRVDVLAAAPAAADPDLRGLLAAGVDGVARVWSDSLVGAGADAAARALAGPLEDAGADLVLTSDRGLDGGRGVLGPMLAELLGLPQATAVEQLAITASGGEVTVRRRLDRGAREQLVLCLPAVVCVEPRIAALADAPLPALLASSSAPVPVLAPAGVPPGCRLVRRLPPRPRPRRLPAPDPALPVEARLAAVLGGGNAREGEHAVAEGPPEVLVERILRLLEERGYLTSSSA